MKKYYKINEIAKLYHIGVDSLRYYEKVGLISPKRDENQYRQYSIYDIWRLNVIRDMMELDISSDKIKTYLDHRSIASTLDMLDSKQQLIQQKLEALLEDQQEIKNRKQAILKAIAYENNSFEQVHYPARKCMILKENIKKDEDIDYLITKLSSELETKISILGNTSTGSFLIADEDGIFHNHSVFILMEEIDHPDFILEEGEYLSLTYHGYYDQHNEHVTKLLNEVEKRGYRYHRPIMEILLIDIHETKDKNEYVTQLQVRIEKKS